MTSHFPVRLKLIHRVAQQTLKKIGHLRLLRPGLETAMLSSDEFCLMVEVTRSIQSQGFGDRLHL